MAQVVVGAEVNLPQAIGNGFHKYIDFTGRASRSEFWFWTLFAWIATGGLTSVLPYAAGEGGSSIVGLISLLLFLPSLAVTVRRLHDVGKSPLYLLINLIPLVGPFIFLASLVKPGTPGDNMYGPNPLGIYAPNYYQSQQYLPTMGQRAELPAPSAFPGYGFNVGADQREPVAVPRQTDVWAQQFNRLHQQARAEVPEVYKRHYFTEEEMSALRAGRPQAVLLEDRGGEFYLAEVAWTGSDFTESRLDVPNGI